MLKSQQEDEDQLHHTHLVFFKLLVLWIVSRQFKSAERAGVGLRFNTQKKIQTLKLFHHTSDVKVNSE